MESKGSHTTGLSTCQYLKDRPCQLDYRYLAQVSGAEHEALLASGVRHFGHLYFEPRCPACRQCLSLRVPIATFRTSRSQRRVVARNRDVEIEVGPPAVDAERLDLYHRFHAMRRRTHAWRWSERSPAEFFDAFVAGPVPVVEFRYRLGGRLVALAYVDETPTAMSSIYGVWEPDEAKRGLGTFDVLCELEAARRLGKQYFYLGYYVEGCPSLEYKAAFRPHELLREGVWQPAQPPLARSPAGDP